MRRPTLLRIITATPLFVLSACQLLVVRETEGGEHNPQGRGVWITARNSKGTAPELSASDLEVKIDGKPAGVSDVRRSIPTLSYCLLIDISGSTRAARKPQYDTAVALLSKVPRAGRDYGVLIDFNDKAYVDAEGTDPQKLIKGINQDARSSTAMYDAMAQCSAHLSKNDETTNVGDFLRVMFVLSDGEDNSSVVTKERAEHNLVAKGFRVYSIGQKDVGGYSPSQAAKASKTLKQFAEVTGGKSYLPAKEMTPEQIVDDIASDLANLYAVTLSSQGTLPGDRVYKLEVRCGKRGFAVTAPREYFVPLQ